MSFPKQLSRLLNRDGGHNIQRAGISRNLFGDLYHYLLATSWPGLLGILFALYLAGNSLFALGYLAGGDCIENARPGSFADAFFFSVQTMATIGYGKLAPRTLYAHLLVTGETFVGLLGV